MRPQCATLAGTYVGRITSRNCGVAFFEVANTILLILLLSFSSLSPFYPKMVGVSRMVDKEKGNEVVEPGGREGTDSTATRICCHCYSAQCCEFCGFSKIETFIQV